MKISSIHSFLLFVILYSTSLYCRAQDTGQRIEPLKVGDTVPEVIFHKMINYKGSTAKLSDFKGKAIILDFWATYCSPCIEGFPKLEKYQMEFEKDLKILLLSYHDERAIRELYKNKPDLILPTAFYDRKKDVISKLFPYKEIPHYIWINAEGKIAAITNALEISEDNIIKLVENKPLDVRMKDDQQKWGDHSGVVLDSIEKKGKANRISINPNIVFQSMIMKYDPRLTQVGIEGVEHFRNKYLTLQNSSVTHLMWTALGLGRSKDHWRYYIDLNDSTFVYPSSNSPIEYQRTWWEKYSYTYRVLLDRPDSILLHKIMQRDLELYFGIRTFNRKMRLPYLVLRAVSDNSKLKEVDGNGNYTNSTIYNITIRNKPIGDLVSAIYNLQIGKEHRLKQQKRLAVFDQTNITGNVSIEISNINIRDMDELNRSLKEYGLELSLEYGDLDMVVMTDKQI